MGANIWMLATGLVLGAVGLVLRHWANRNSLMDKTTDAVWEAVKARDSGAVRQHIEGTIGEITNEPAITGRARKAASMAVREASARAAAFTGAMLLALGLVLAVLAFAWA
jgi:hypothetical protein